MRKERSPYHHVIVATKLCKQLSVFAHFSETMASHDVLIVRVVGTNLCDEVAHEDLDITFRNLVQGSLQLTVKVLFILQFGSVGWRVTLDHGKVSNPCSESGYNCPLINSGPNEPDRISVARSSRRCCVVHRSMG